MEKTPSAIKKLVPVEGIEKTLEIPPDPAFGDVASTVCFGLAKQERAPPAAIAERIVKDTKIPANSAIERMEARGGYINFFFNRRNLARIVIPDALSKAFGKPKTIAGKVMVEHTSVNPNKALHVGHIRNSCLGDSIVRILKFCGRKVQEVNYIDDSGTQLADIIIGFKFLRMPAETKMKFDQYCGNEVYVKVNKIYENDSALGKKRQEVIREIESGNNETSEFAERIVERIIRAQLETLRRLDIGFDLMVTETSVLRAKLWEAAFKKMDDAGIICKEADGKNAGCWVLRLSDRPEFSGLENADKILVRSDGTVLYTGKDIAYAMWKHGLLKDAFNYKRFSKSGSRDTWITTGKGGEKRKPSFGNVDKAVALVDVRQSYAQDVVSAALAMLGDKKDYVHYDYGVVSLSKNTAKQLGIGTGDEQVHHMSGRKGIFVNVDDVLDILGKKAYEETAKRNDGASRKWITVTAGKIARSALRYEMTKIDRENTMTFDIEESLRLDGNTAPYLQYTYARSMKILEKAGKVPEFAVPAAITDTELELAKALMSFPRVVEKSCDNLSPQEISRYAYSLCTLFNRFYQDSPVLRAEGATKAFRLSLVKAFVSVLGKCLNMIGVDALEKM